MDKILGILTPRKIGKKVKKIEEKVILPKTPKNPKNMALPQGVKSPVDYTKLYMSNELEGEMINEKALSKSQQRFMGMVYAYLKGEMPNASDEVKKAAKSMSKKDAEKYASTKHAKLPEKVISDAFLPEVLDKKDIPFIKKLIKALKDGSMTHLGQSKKLAKALKEQLGGTGTKVAPSSQEMKKKLTVTKEPLTKQSLETRKQDQANITDKMNQLGGITKTTSQNGKLDSMSIQGVGAGTNKDALKSVLAKSATGVKMDADGVVPDAGAVVQQQAMKGMNIAQNTMNNNPTKFTSSQKQDVNTAMNYAKSGQIKTDINRQIPGTQQFRYDIAADEINLASQKNKPKTNKGLKIGMQKEDITDEALTIQDWNIDNIKFTEIETVDIIKPKPLKESMSNWREELDEDWQKVNRKDKTDGLSRKAVKAYRRENPGSKLQTAVTKDPKKLKKGSKSAKRRLSFCRRMKGMKKKLTSAKTRRDPDSRINKALRRWNC